MANSDLWVGKESRPSDPESRHEWILREKSPPQSQGVASLWVPSASGLTETCQGLGQHRCWAVAGGELRCSVRAVHLMTQVLSFGGVECSPGARGRSGRG